MTTKEKRSPSTVDILKRNLTLRPLDVAQILLERATGQTTQRVAILRRGESMHVVTPEGISTQLWLSGDFEPEVTSTLEAIVQKDMVVWNIGSHIGTRVVQSDALVGKAGEIIAFEPTPRTKKILDLNSTRRISHIQTFPYAMGNKTGTTPFRDYGWLGSGLNTAAKTSRYQPEAWKKEPKYQEITAQMMTVDDLMNSTRLKGPDILVIDAEGYELQIFEGAQTTIAAFKPIIVFETGDLGESNTFGCMLRLSGLGYRFFEYFDGSVVPHVTKDHYSEPGNLIAIHPLAPRRVTIKN